MRRRLLIPLIAVLIAFGFLQFKQRYLDYKPTPIAQQKQISLPDRIEQVSNSVVHITNETQGRQGSGVVISPDIIMTARHLVEDGGDFTITLSDGGEIKATQAISSKKYDLGFIKIEKVRWPCGKPILKPARLGSVKDCRLGQQVFVIGSPYGKLNFNSVTLGIISGLNRDFDEWVVKRGYSKYGWSITFTTDAAGHPGNSGCPIFTMDGRVRGVLVGGFSPVLVYCVPVDLVAIDLPLISALFAMDNYYIEEVKEWQGYEQYCGE
jgi:S1-C subfamily serine protease